MPSPKRTLAALAAGVAIAIAFVECSRGASDERAVVIAASPSPSTTISPHAEVTDRAAVERGSIAGAIRDEAGAPIAGARVCARASTATDPHCATSDAGGAYAIAPLPSASYEVAASARPYRATTWTRDGRRWLDVHPGEAHAGIDLVLARGGVELTGTVRDAGGDAVPHARVRISAAGTLAIDSDEHGRYSAWVDPGMVGVLAVADGYATASRQGRAPGTVDLELLPESAYGGTVVDAATGAPVAGVRVTVRGAAPSERATPEGETAFTDELGRFRIGRLEPGYYMAAAQSPHGVGRSAGTVELGLGRSVDDVVVRLFPGHPISGRIARPDGSTCLDASLSLRDEEHDRYAGSYQDLDGTLHVDGLSPGTYAVTVWCPEHLSQPSYPPIVVGDDDVTGLVWPVSTGAALTGRITTSKGVPLAKAAVFAYGVRTGPRDVPPVGAAQTDASGRFEVRGIPPGRYRVEAQSRSARRSIEVALEVPGHHDFVIDDGLGDLAGRVTRADGTPVRAAAVTAKATVGDESYTTGADDGGYFLLDSIAPGDYLVSVAVRGVPAPATSSATVRIDGTTDVRLVVANAARELRGRVVDAHGAPVGDARVSVGDYDEHALLVATDGTFVLTGLDDGAYTVRATRPNGTTAVAEHVPAGGTATLRMPATGAIVGSARAAVPLDDLDIVVTRGQDHASAREEHVYRSSAFAFHDLEAGHYTLAFLASNLQHVVDVDLAAGQTVTLDVEIPSTVTLVGRTVDKGTGAPVAGVSLRAGVHELTYTPDSEDRVHVSDATGHFTIRRVPRGKLVISGAMRVGENTWGAVVGFERDVTGVTGPVIDLGEIAVTPP